MAYQTVIGLEVHAQLLTRSKLFCGCSTRFGAPPNTQTCPVCLGLPGALPVLNREAVAMAVRAALALDCEIQPRSVFARKNYFYPDLPKGYQISQFDLPLAEHGRVKVLSGERTEDGHIVNRIEKSFGITRLHLEEDAGKSLHDGMPDSQAISYVDLNRSGVPLIEIVSEPDFRSSQEAYDTLTQLRKTLLFLGVCDGNMEEGSLRCDANVSIRAGETAEFGTKVEIKNLNSFRYLQRALEYEIQRQAQVLAEGGRVMQETRLWDEAKGCTVVMRTKEEAHDYRYFPEPDLPPLELDAAWIAAQRSSLPELPHEKTLRFMAEYGLSSEEALPLTSSPAMAAYYTECARAAGNPRAALHWMTGELAYALKNSGAEIENCPLPPDRLAGLIRMIDVGEISGKIGKTVFEELYQSGEEACVIVQRLGLAQISDGTALEAVIDRILAANPRQLAEYRSGKEKLFGYFVGQAMKETRGQANPQLLNDLVKRKLAP
jgi:aspartyl-tRNA(Asn)/glutamyl-tRNA(Gln) amidotransferase subunit B